MGIFNKSFLKDLFFSAQQRDLEPLVTKHNYDVMKTSMQAVAICEKFMKGKVENPITTPPKNGDRAKPLNCLEFPERLRF